MVDTAIRESFRRNGYYVIRQAFSGAYLEELRGVAQALRDRVEAEPTPGMRYWTRGVVAKEDLHTLPNSSDFSWGVNEITRPELFDPRLLDAISCPPVLSALHAILDEPRAWGQKLLWAPRANSYNLGWHRDIEHRYDALMPYKPSQNDHVQFNAALEPDDGFIVVPSSNRRELRSEEAQALQQSMTCALPDEFRVCLEPGDIVCMDAHSIHRGQANAGAPRLSLHYSFQAQWVPLKPWGSKEDFDWICSDAFIEQLAPGVRPMYERLRSAEKYESEQYHLTWLEEAARQEGWSGAWSGAWPNRAVS